jgi:hypothetical protein
MTAVSANLQPLPGGNTCAWLLCLGSPSSFQAATSARRPRRNVSTSAFPDREPAPAPRSVGMGARVKLGSYSNQTISIRSGSETAGCGIGTPFQSAPKTLPERPYNVQAQT